MVGGFLSYSSSLFKMKNVDLISHATLESSKKCPYHARSFTSSPILFHNVIHTIGRYPNKYEVEIQNKYVQIVDM